MNDKDIEVIQIILKDKCLSADQKTDIIKEIVKEKTATAWYPWYVPAQYPAPYSTEPIITCGSSSAGVSESVGIMSSGNASGVSYTTKQ